MTMHISSVLLSKAIVESGLPSEHETIASERSVGVSVVIVEVSGDVDVRLKWYATSVPTFLGLKCLPMLSFW